MYNIKSEWDPLSLLLGCMLVLGSTESPTMDPLPRFNLL